MSQPKQSQLGATFVPGGYDDICMPEFVPPLPQRTTSEIPSNMQGELQHFDHEANKPRNRSISSNVPLKSPILNQDEGRLSTLESRQVIRPGYEHTNGSVYQNISNVYRPFLRTESLQTSPFPKVRNSGLNVPLSSEDKGEVLEQARHQILKSTNPEVQLAWAQDALSWADIENDYVMRTESNDHPTRPMTPKLEHQLREDAVNIVRHLGEQGHPKAEFIQAYWLEFGKFGYRMNKKEAFLGYIRAADNGYARAQYRIGMQYENSNNIIKAVEHYCKGIAMKDSASHYRLAMMNLLGQHGTPQDYGRGIDLVRFAAETADENAPQGAYVYGMLLARELPNIDIPEQYLPYDIVEARLYIEKAAYLGFGKALSKMGLAYELCQLGCEFDPTLSLHYNALASRQGEAAADMAISKWFLCGFDGIFEKNEELAFSYAKRAAAAKLPMAEFAMGYFYEIGMYVSADLAESEKWYQRAVDHGNTDALVRINSIKANNTFSKKDHEQIAIKKIKSQYGSQIGTRPDRFKKLSPSIATTSVSVTDIDRTDMSDVRHTYSNPPLPRKNPNESRNSYSSQMRADASEARTSHLGSSRTEVHDTNKTYSMSPVPPRRSSNMPPTHRPVSLAPYPEDDEKIPGYGLNIRIGSSAGPQSDRPVSAFGIKPIVTHQNPEPSEKALSPRTHSQIRPSTSMGAMPTIHSRDSCLGDQVTSPGRDVQQPSYSPDGSGRGRFSSSSINKPRHPPFSEEYHRRQSASSHEGSLSKRDSSGKQFMRPERVSSANMPQLQQSSSRLSHRQSQQAAFSQQPGLSPKDSRSDSRPLPSPPVASPTTPGPKKTGPATFEEMGIPAANKEGDCVRILSEDCINANIS
ncbi:chitin synthase activator [Blumeria hordei DH14]|uniref:Chitin synthase activator n=1 Tax=Blumeria graminis f. sp. hordei (strain DH14) TaxID=546991 RepID=N1J778_BLUG1|nr:chitin synthase activator [Blumeria hordei DH14]